MPTANPLGGNIRLVGKDDRPKTAEEGRRCAEEDCGVILSRYNTGDRCWTHTDRNFHIGPTRNA